MNQRPKSVTTVCWVLIALSVLFFLLNLVALASYPEITATFEKSGLPRGVLYFYLITPFILPVINFILAILMLKQHNWARYTYLIINGVLFIALLITTENKLTAIIYIIIFLMILCFLFNKNANSFFKAKKE